MLLERMAPLLERGRAAYKRWLEQQYAPEEMPFGYEAVAIVTTTDFITYPRLCLEYALTVRSVQIVDDDGRITTLLCRHSGSL